MSSRRLQNGSFSILSSLLTRNLIELRCTVQFNHVSALNVVLVHMWYVPYSSIQFNTVLLNAKLYPTDKENKWLKKEIGNYDDKKCYLIFGENFHGLSVNRQFVCKNISSEDMYQELLGSGSKMWGGGGGAGVKLVCFRTHKNFKQKIGNNVSSYSPISFFNHTFSLSIQYYAGHTVP
jgi:hypothetical protein